MSLEINEQFQHALDVMEKSTKHVFLTGKAGTGKSTLLTYFRGTTHKNHVVLASTGAAAVNIGGQTIHSFFHFMPDITEVEARRLGRTHQQTKLIQKLQAIVIDEVSMVRADLLDCVDAFLKEARKSKEPFAGIQMIFIGDMYQLPPVVGRDEVEIFARLYDSPYFFDSESFKRISKYEEFYEHIELQKIYRQSDEEFIGLLNGIRNRELHSTNLAILNDRTQHDIDITTDYIYLVTTNKAADEINRANLDKLYSEEQIFYGDVKGDFENKNLPTDASLTLKVGARVMFLNNDQEDRWINGTLGEVLGFYSDEANDNMPIIEVKKDDGQTVDVYPHTWTNYKSMLNEETGRIEKEAAGSYTQIPLKLAWAITIHKSQGKTFDKVIIDIGWGAFASGQVYVALSRCRTLEGIILKKPIQYKHILLDDRIKQFFAGK
jgi:ATP-dependent DNA helicase PIF1